ncbi:UbiA family prenyltransferase [Lactococcus petauri]|uniref:UbiA family prenyltransferase n=1 Tax=Lactococcus garvieae TaxID=1363 RepID=A0AA46TTR3_9LACT|nr:MULTISPECIES: UbiA family prenyltransferase [Lactococcus]KXT62512.1 putative prenyltransferase, contains 1,4-dihydroxy-2-naphthoate octaprenyltransferase domain [Lactococcus sp. DD01]MDC0824898.1 UbiA family prenyltransferase [Lactococcus petauri]NHI77203.1 prenyltransferase [Lactococcus petauri]UYT09427.1 UbiA family prenyltransferase [Lactococcus garvieae]UYT13337.1 UbiA family prenyltransferase [Lactococcus garvieae]
MNVKTFLNFTRIQTLPVALLSPLAGIMFSLWYFHSFHLLPTLLFLIGLAAINLFVSAWNNLMDYHKALDPEYKTQQNIISNRNINPKLALKICLLFLFIDIVVGLAVMLITNLAILPVGGLCFIVAIFYTYGPFAFSRFPLGEILAGLCEGFFGFFLAVYINSYDLQYFFIQFDGWKMNWTWDFSQLLPIVLIGIMCFCQNFNVMLSDNICDLEQDIRNQRFTLPYYLKIPASLVLYKVMYIIPALCVSLAIILGILPIWSALMLLILFELIPNMKKFLHKQVKSETFHYQIKNLILYNGSLALTLFIAIIFN